MSSSILIICLSFCLFICLFVGLCLSICLFAVSVRLNLNFIHFISSCFNKTWSRWDPIFVCWSVFVCSLESKFLCCFNKTWSRWGPMTMGGTPKFADFTIFMVHPPRDIVIICNYCNNNNLQRKTFRITFFLFSSFSFLHFLV